MPSWALFETQDAAYRESVLPTSVRARVSVEAGTTLGWSRWIGEAGVAVGVDHFGASAPSDVLYERFGVTTERVVIAARESVRKAAALSPASTHAPSNGAGTATGSGDGSIEAAGFASS